MLILASASPRRARLLEQMGVSFQVHPSDVEEIIPKNLSDPGMITEHLALQKAQSVATAYPDDLTLGADTIVVLDGHILGKPEDEAEAFEMLRSLSGRTHTVYTGLALVCSTPPRQLTTHDATEVTFDELTDSEIRAYLATGSPMDKAGAYGIQEDYGALFVRRIKGDYYNVVGLPLNRLYRLLHEHFSDQFFFNNR